MDQLLFHPKVVHVPIALALLMPVIASGVALAWWKGWFDRRVWVIVLLLQGVLVGSGFLAMNTGETEEERVEEAVPEAAIEEHEEAAEIFVWASGILLALMVVPLALREGQLRNATVATACIGTAIVLAFGFRAGEAGGRLVYQHGAAQVYVDEAAASSAAPIQALEEYEDEGDED
ncbi:MAG: hypothetical protein AMJ62_05935 [Myxococcales bacterium SG8_38]|nr:MAG: hypothetical protein AMJ62_05935 [Myxococcales bacterium SG8_38]